jgi:transposase
VAIDAMKERASAPSSTSATYGRLKRKHQKRRPKYMIYVGIDLHRKWSQLAALDAAGEQQLSRRIPSRPEEFFRVFGELGPEPMEVAFEATFGCSWLVDLLADAGIPAHMAHPLATKAIAAGRVKNDAVDARTLAHLLRTNLLPESWIAPVEAREARRLVRMRASLVRLSSRLKCQVHALLADYGVNPELTDVFGRQGRRIMAELRLPEVSQHRLEVNLRLLDGLAHEVKAVDQMLKQRFGRDARALRLLPVPGIGLFTSATIVAEVWDVSRFSSARHLASWAGLTPREHSSGDHTRRGHISKQGSRWLRWVLVEAATHGLRDPQLRELYLRVRRGSKERDQIARVAVAHRLLTLCYYALRDEAGCRAYPVSA